jgi:hypothetical protein
MYLKCGFLFCENEHGLGEVTFPRIEEMDAEDIRQRLLYPPTEAQTRRDAKKLGWRRIHRADYCPGCVANEEV